VTVDVMVVRLKALLSIAARVTPERSANAQSAHACVWCKNVAPEKVPETDITCATQGRGGKNRRLLVCVNDVNCDEYTHNRQSTVDATRGAQHTVVFVELKCGTKVGTRVNLERDGADDLFVEVIHFWIERVSWPRKSGVILSELTLRYGCCCELAGVLFWVM
jgi:hypothetical protein